MPRARNPLRDEARRMWEESRRSMKLTDIAKALSLPSNTVRKWKTEDKWESERSDSEKQAETERKGAERERKQRERRTEKKMVEAVQQNETLSEQERLFCLLFVKSFNATRSYQRAYGCAYNTALTNGSRLLGYARVKDEVHRLKSLRSLDLMADVTDLVMLHIRIAFADITDFVEFTSEPMPIKDGDEPVYTLNMETGDMEPEMKNAGYIDHLRLRDSAEIDGQMIREIRVGSNGTSVKLEDRQRSLAFLERYFLTNPADALHSKESRENVKRLDTKELESLAKEYMRRNTNPG